ncbi:HIT-like protein, partial [Cylindrobasidium torrendii FP15055 ss-10]
MSHLTILRKYAVKSPADLPPSVLFGHTDQTLTIYDAFPKSIFHFLIVPRHPQRSLSLSDLGSLRSLLKLEEKEQAKDVLLMLKAEAASLRKEIEEEMLTRHGFKWGIWTGFHGAPSMDHLHLHVLSADLCSERMKNKKHYNSFHPKLGFFLDIDEVLSWFDAEPTYFRKMASLDHKAYDALLKGPLSCFHCGIEQKNMPLLKAHLQEEFDELAMREKTRQERKRKIEAKQAAARGVRNAQVADASGEEEPSEEPQSKKRRTESPVES